MRRRVTQGQVLALNPKTPTVTLTRVQSGVGALTIEAMCSDAVGDLRLGAAVDLVDAEPVLLQRDATSTTVPQGSARPLLLAHHRHYEELVLDLLQSRSLHRLVIFAFSPSGASLSWGGTLVISTFGGSRLELDMDAPAAVGVRVLASVYNVDGELVVRAEPGLTRVSIREACVAYGFDRLRWIDANNAVS